jgi:hypothetical protein
MIYGSAVYATDIYGRVETGVERSTGIVSTLFLTDVSSQSIRKITRVSAPLLLQDTVEGKCSKISSTVSVFNLNESLVPTFTYAVTLQPSLYLTDFATITGIYTLSLQDSSHIESQLRLRYIHKTSLDSLIYLDALAEPFRGIVADILAQYSLTLLCGISCSRSANVLDLVAVNDWVQCSAFYRLGITDTMFCKSISSGLLRIPSGIQSEVLLDTVASCFLSAIPELTVMVQRYRVTGSVRRR